MKGLHVCGMYVRGMWRGTCVDGRCIAHAHAHALHMHTHMHTHMHMHMHARLQQRVEVVHRHAAERRHGQQVLVIAPGQG